MNKLLLSLLIIAPLSASAIQWKIFGACSNEPVYQGQYTADLEMSVGAVTEALFQSQGIPYIGSAEGFNSINNSPIGLDALEIVSDTEMRAYGWCYTVNGKQPTQMPHELKFLKQEDKLIWFYGYSTNIKNEWIDYCQPAYWIKAKQFCGR